MEPTKLAVRADVDYFIFPAGRFCFHDLEEHRIQEGILQIIARFLLVSRLIDPAGKNSCSRNMMIEMYEGILLLLKYFYIRLFAFLMITS